MDVVRTDIPRLATGKSLLPQASHGISVERCFAAFAITASQSALNRCRNIHNSTSLKAIQRLCH